MMSEWMIPAIIFLYGICLFSLGMLFEILLRERSIRQNQITSGGLLSGKSQAGYSNGDGIAYPASHNQGNRGAAPSDTTENSDPVSPTFLTNEIMVLWGSSHPMGVGA